MKSIYTSFLLFSILTYNANARLARQMIREIQQMPISRLITNLNAQIDKSNNSQDYAFLARAYALAYASGNLDKEYDIELVRNIYESNKTVATSSIPVINLKKTKPKKVDTSNENLRLAKINYEKAGKLSVIHMLGYGWVLKESKDKKHITVFNELIDQVIKDQQMADIDDVDAAIEAAEYLKNNKTNSKAQNQEILKKDKMLKHIKENMISERKSIKKGGVLKGRLFTPLIININYKQKQTDLINKDSDVLFDLNASGNKLKWGWPKKDVGILVYDPTFNKTHLSGIDLFGSLSFFIFWNNGFEALRSFDDDQNGLIESTELAGIYLWLDNNQNGTVESDERHQLSKYKIKALSVDYTLNEKSDIAPLWNKNGVILEEGSLPLFDWHAKLKP